MPSPWSTRTPIRADQTGLRGRDSRDLSKPLVPEDDRFVPKGPAVHNASPETPMASVFGEIPAGADLHVGIEGFSLPPVAPAKTWQGRAGQGRARLQGEHSCGLARTAGRGDPWPCPARASASASADQITKAAMCGLERPTVDACSHGITTTQPTAQPGPEAVTRPYLLAPKGPQCASNCRTARLDRHGAARCHVELPLPVA
ncbi:hypothetical protein J3E72DRAFT_273179 [Bipolaris maydis]|nr:hypothetical protein J3E72DRAFT_273179 [Bipolaris maydis]